MIFDVAVIIPTMLSRRLARAVRSVYTQEFDGRVQILVGIDLPLGSGQVLSDLKAECPPRMELTVLDLGYSTALRHGGIYPTFAGGALRTLLSFAANSHLLAYLDDDNWWAPGHLKDLYKAVQGVDWAYSYRWYVHPTTHEPLCVDEWESVGPDRGLYRKDYGGFVDTNCLMINKMKCHWVLPAWCVPEETQGEGEDRVIFNALRGRHPSSCTGNATAYYVIRPGDLWKIRRLMARKQSKPGKAAAGEE